MNISKVSTGLNAAFGLKFRVAFGEFPQYGVSFKVQGSEVPGFRVQYFRIKCLDCFAVSSDPCNLSAVYLTFEPLNREPLNQVADY